MKRMRFAMIGAVVFVAGCCLLSPDPASPFGFNLGMGALSVRIDGSELERGLEVDESVSLSAIAIGGTPPLTYAWSLSNGSVGELIGTTGSSTQFRSQVVGTAGVIVSVTDSVGATASDSLGIEVSISGPRG